MSYIKSYNRFAKTSFSQNGEGGKARFQASTVKFGKAVESFEEDKTPDFQSGEAYKELIVWQKSIELVKEIFSLTQKFPRSELYGLVSQMRRAAVAIPSNIAEGYGRRSRKEYRQFYSIAYGSGLELETQLFISKDLDFASPNEFQKSEALLSEVLKMLNSMRAKLNARR